MSVDRQDAFARYHPAVNLLYFVLVLVYAMCLMHPVCLGVSLLCAVWYSTVLRGRRAVRFNVLYMLPLLVLAAIINPAFNHAGLTVLRLLPNGNPLTLESIVYGAAAAVMVVSLVIWFTCVHVIMTSDKLVYLFGRLIPALSLVLAMTLRFVPRFMAQARRISAAQRCMGHRRGLRTGIRVFSILVTWSLENAVETAASMKSRGYGLPGRSAFSLYRFRRHDRWALVWLIIWGGYVLAGWIAGGLHWQYYPSLELGVPGPYGVSLFCAQLLLCLTPVLLDLRERLVWRRREGLA
ncbi:MAG: energy-coupling factor transporter transmembrane protein EcfT [Oscillospiraceae bacterium]|nr:energy-coupling factor transporter transmembrane protein EcfT [Oscillospiraceae bacterium]